MAFAIRKGRNLNRIDLLQKRNPDRITPVKLGSIHQRRFNTRSGVSRGSALLISFPITGCRRFSRATWGLGAKIEQPIYQFRRMDHTPEDVVIMGVCKMGIGSRGFIRSWA